MITTTDSEKMEMWRAAAKRLEAQKKELADALRDLLAWYAAQPDGSLSATPPLGAARAALAKAEGK